ncbi:thiamine phosphate synthase [Chitinophaga japonensis]|uniref:Thiamine-phosphate pyrophosphorylase n=1 Tax=Chitinophaga japonensis TaxID=104662 RepID=A0A562TDH0_CHIJA|nr:thiamine phosphate synthase [Chitinophaga japonensis]TWI91607.1 thiamine-phosphate pyrophosphorylase [Chitinophaga japonensis]
MLLIITHPETLPQETARWQELLAAGADALLLRKPGRTQEDYARLLDQVDPVCYSRILVAEHWPLCRRYGLMGVHYSERLRNSGLPQPAMHYPPHCLLSTGIHDTAALPAAAQEWDLLLLSPVFDSISKPGYKSRYPAGFRLQRPEGRARILALGGVNHTNAARAREMGFDGIALLGAIWNTPGKAVEQYNHISNIWNANAHTL